MGDIRQDCLISAAPASSDKSHQSNYKAFLDDDVTAERRYTAIEMFNAAMSRGSPFHSLDGGTMQVSNRELRERYQAASTDELLQIKISSELTDAARSLLEDELSRRDVTPDDYENARNVEAVIKADRGSLKRHMIRRIRRFVIFLVLLVLIALMAILFGFLQ